jgi:RND family efflux transporter MFP subunit
MRIVLRLLIPLLIIVSGWFLMKQFARPDETIDSEETAQEPERPTQKAEVIPLERQDYQVTIQANGVVQAHTTTQLTARVGGRVESLHPRFEPGAFFEKGDILVNLDATDTEAAIVGAEAEVARAEAALLQEESRSKQAELNWQDLGYTEKPNELVLRIPQLKEARANLKTAKAQLAEAKRNKLYTKVVAPFDGCVRTRLVGPGQSVGSNTALGEIFATDYAEVRLPLSPRDLPFTPFQNQSQLAATTATLYDGLTMDREEARNITWEAELMRSEGVIDETSRELFLIARITDPYGLHSGRPPLRVGQPVEAEIPGNKLENVFVIPRESLLGAFETLLVDNETLKIRRYDIKPFWEDGENLIVSQELPENHSIVMTRLSSAANGSVIEIIEPEEETTEATKAVKTGSSGESSKGA